jgi:hypothetical protein
MILKQHRITIAALVLVIAAMFAAPASARPIDEVGPASQPTSSTPGSLDRPPPSSPTPFGTEQAATGATTPTEVRVVRVTSESEAGFDWGDAGIGAGAALAITMIGLGGALAVSSRRHRERSDAAVA